VIVRGGIVHGTVRARTSIEIHAPAKMIGNIHSPSLFIDRGVEFQGSCRMDPVEERGEVELEESAEKPARDASRVPPLPQPRA
jgi:cytoskeletal protein CcmA (bactofilin family)